MQKLLNRTGWILAAVLAVAIVALTARIVRGGPLDPANPPAPTLSQVEPRQPIPPVGWNGAFPIEINEPGSYYLTRSLVSAGGFQNGITINADGVTLDLNGFELRGVAASLDGISIPALRGDIVIENGIVRGWGSNGIDAAAAVRSRFTDLIVSLNGEDGLRVGQGSVVERVISSENDGSGIDVLALNFYRGGAITDSTFANNDQHGIELHGSYSEMRSNVIAGNGPGGYNAISVFSDYNVIVSNMITSNGGSAVRLEGDANVVWGNTATGNSGSIVDAGAGNRVGPTVSDAALTTSNPFANVQFDNPPP